MLANDTFLDSFASYLQMPIALIKRIEIIRGPGSRTDGINAYAGTVNIITYAEKSSPEINKVFVSGGSYNHRSGGLSYTQQFQTIRYHLDAYFLKNDKTLYAGPDTLATGSLNFPLLGIDNSALAQSGQAPLQTTSLSLGFQADWHEWNIKGRITSFRHGSAYGINAMLPESSDHINLPAMLAEVGYAPRFNTFNLKLKAGIRFDKFQSKARLAPPGLVFPTPQPPYHTIFTDGFYGEHEAAQQNFYQSTYIEYTGFSHQHITAGYRIEAERTVKVVTKTTDRLTGSGMTDYSESAPFIDPDAYRSIAGFTLQDEIELGNRIGILAGLNIEKTSLSDIQYDPRISVVYRHDMYHIFKAIYSHSHRNPSWQELFTVNNSARVGNRDLKPEQVDAFEIAAIRRFNSTDYLQLDVYTLQNRDQIDKNNPQHRYRNAHDTLLYGLDAEWSMHLGSKDRVYLTYAYVTGEDENGDIPPNIARHLANLSEHHNFGGGLSATALVRYIGAKERSPNDGRDPADAFLSADLTLRYADAANGVSLTATVKNIADASGVYPAEADTYINDYPREGRTFYVQFQKAF